MDKQTNTRVDAVERLNAASEDLRQRVEQHDAASGSSSKLSALVERQAAEDQFAAREAWVKWTERSY